MRKTIVFFMLIFVLSFVCSVYSAAAETGPIDNNANLNVAALNDDQPALESKTTETIPSTKQPQTMVEVPGSKWCQCIRGLLHVESGDVSCCVGAGISQDKITLYKLVGSWDNRPKMVSFLLKQSGCGETKSLISVPEKQIAAPELQQPGNSAIVQEGHIIFSWSVVPDASAYRIQVAKDNLFTETEINVTTASALYETPADMTSGNYYWRVSAAEVVAENTAGRGWSPIWKFTVRPVPPSNLTRDAFINQGAALTSSATVSLAISAASSHAKGNGIVGYYVSEKPSTPKLRDQGWVAIHSTRLYSDTVSFTLSRGEGTKKVFVWFKDARGQLSAVKKASIVLEAGVPHTAITAKPDNPTNKLSASFVLTSTKQATFECRIDNGQYTACTSPASYSNLASNVTHTFTVRSTDAAGNTDPTPATYSWVIDTIAPDTAITSQPGNPTNQVSASFVLTSTEAATFECRIDNGQYTACTSPASYSNLASNTTHTFSVRSTDAAGNTDATPATYSWVIDTIAPDTAITSQRGNPTNGVNASFSFTSTEAAKFECQIDKGEYAPCTSPANYSNLASNTTHTFTVRSTDAAEHGPDAGDLLLGDRHHCPGYGDHQPARKPDEPGECKFRVDLDRGCHVRMPDRQRAVHRLHKSGELQQSCQQYDAYLHCSFD